MYYKIYDSSTINSSSLSRKEIFHSVVFTWMVSKLWFCLLCVSFLILLLIRSSTGLYEKLNFLEHNSHILVLQNLCAGVHDSFWTHACDVDKMNRILREKFVELYSMPILENVSVLQPSFPILMWEPVNLEFLLDVLNVTWRSVPLRLGSSGKGLGLGWGRFQVKFYWEREREKGEKPYFHSSNLYLQLRDIYIQG